MNSLFKFLSFLSLKHPKKTIVISSLFAIIFAVYGFFHIKFDTNQDNLMSPQAKYFQDYKNFLQEFGDWEYFYIVIETNQKHHQAKNFAKDLIQVMQKRKDLFAEIFYKIPIDIIEKNALYLLNHQEFSKLKTLLIEQKQTLSDFLNVNSLQDWYAFLAKNFKTSSSLPQDNMQKIWPYFLANLFAPYEQKSLLEFKNWNILQSLSEDYYDDEGFLFTKNGNLLFVKALPQKNFQSMEIVKKPIEFLRSNIKSLVKKYPKINVGLTGKPVLQNDEAQVTSQDSEIAGIASFVSVLLLFALFFRSFKRSFFALTSLFIGICWTVGFVAIFYAKVNLLTLSFAIILIGLGIDYAIHFLVRYLNDLNVNLLKDIALKETLTYTGKAILLGAITSALAFSTAIFTDFLGLQELGIITGSGIILCCLAQLIVYPALLKLFDKKHLNTKEKVPNFSSFSFVTKKPLWTLGITSLLVILCIPFIFKSEFEFNLLKLQYQNLESVKYENIIQKKSDESTWFLVYLTPDLNDLRIKQKAFSQLNSVKRTESILNYLPVNSKNRENFFNQYITNITSTKKNISPSIESSLNIIHTKFTQLSNMALKSAKLEAVEELLRVSDKINALKIKKTEFQIDFLNALKEKQDFVKQLFLKINFSEKDLPKELLKIFKGKNGNYSLVLYPQKNIWGKNQMQEFIEQAKSISPQITGAPITTYESSLTMISGFETVALLTSLIVILLLIFHFKSLKDTALIFLNLVLSITCLIGIMHFLQIKINLANFFALPVLIGTGIDHGIHIIHRYKITHSVSDLFESIIPAVFLSCMTTILGFGSLSFVRHAGLASFGMIMAIGTTLILLSTIIVLPNLLKIMKIMKTK